MPHLQENCDGEDKVPERQDGVPSQTGGAMNSDLPIQEARKGFLSGSEGLLSLALSASMRKNPKEFDSTKQQDTATPQSHHPKEKFVTPSPAGAIRNGVTRYGPMLSIYGSTKLITSPIRVKRRGSRDGDDADESPRSPDPHNSQPSCSGNDKYTTPERTGTKQRKSGQTKRPLEQADFDSALKKARAEVSENAPLNSPPAEVPRKKALISPTSSGETAGEKGEDDESTGAASHGLPYPVHSRPYPHHPSYPPHYHSLSPSHHLYGVHPPASYASGYYGYPPPHPHYMSGHTAPPYYPPYPPHPHMMQHYRSPGRFPHNQSGSPLRQIGKTPLPIAPVSSSEMGTTQPGRDPDMDSINSVSEWQKAAMTTGRPPSANRCMPLKEPIPSKYWGEAEKTKDATLPDFHRLVNFPDFLSKSRGTGAQNEPSAPPAGRKHCVMCGKLRVCSASTLIGRGKGAKSDEASSCHPDDNDSSAHIIPRQNKGLCTACDVTVWVVTSDGLEIKWCKGCKNFRPWAAFGDKGSATKCVRCRDRQREKYAMQKDEIRLRRYKRSTTPDSSESKISGHDVTSGLRTLMTAAEAV